MARARNIKPSFFTNEILGTLDPIVGLTFIGLWCLADKQGRLEDRPLRVKAELFPYREGMDVNGYLTVLERNGFIERYEVDGTKYMQIVNFEKHQAPHHTEKAKGYPSKPASDKGSSVLTVKQPLSDGGHEVPTRSDSLIPDSLIPDSLIPDCAKSASTPHVANNSKPELIGFDVFWNAYDKKVERPAAEKSWKRLAPNAELLQRIIAAVDVYVASTPDKTYRKNPSTWLHNKCWDDEVIVRVPQAQQSFRERDEAAKRKAFEERTGRKWPEPADTNEQNRTIDVTPKFLEIANEHAQQSH